ncbi:glycosyltransferase family 9 protein [Desulfovibrio sp. OttesenSCG-928-C06]|nr:glycosyltransferase family 9 protein [Desulfovibrio sp. OttesenSCG-928-C06]
MDKPVLILQMQRMGDLVLSYPLFGWLSSMLPGTPIWVVGERVFFEGLIELSPHVTYFDYSAADRLKQNEYQLVINLSHRRDAAILAGQLKTGMRLGPYVPDNASPEGQAPLYIEGAWQLYRASINHNNRHNMFHWADLNAMELASLRQMRRTSWPPVKAISKERPLSDKRVGLFVGASEADKRPEPEFWATVASRLMSLGTKPVFMGGKNDFQIAEQASAILKAPFLNQCGKFSINELCMFMRNLDLLVTPDTGPMHIAAWIGLPTLNISMGPVNAWETAPFAPNHYVLRSSISCVGCWTCDRPETRCKTRFSPEKTADIAKLILEGNEEKLPYLNLPGHQLFKTGRDQFGLFTMRQITSKENLRLERSLFWKLFFGIALGKFSPETALPDLKQQAKTLRKGKMHDLLLRKAQIILLALNRAIKSSTPGILAEESFWNGQPPILRPLTSYMQLILQNSEFSRPALANALQLIDFFMSILNEQ